MNPACESSLGVPEDGGGAQKAFQFVERPGSGRHEVDHDGAHIDEVPFIVGRYLPLSPQDIVALGLVHVPEGRRLFQTMSVKDNLLMGAYLRSDRGGIAADLDRVMTIFPKLRERAGQDASGTGC